MNYEIANGLRKDGSARPPRRIPPVRGATSHDLARVLLDVESRTIFVGALCMLPMPDRLGPGEPVTLHVSRPYAEQEGLVGKSVWL